jgi:S1-C subfamily serine protease
MQRHSILLLLLCFGILPATAQTKQKTKTIQKEETVVIRQKDNDETVVEIRDGDVYVNGERVATTGDKNMHKKVVVRSGNGTSSYVMEEDAPASTGSSGKAMLGVYAAPAENGKSGAIIERVMSGSAADDAGLQNGDVITKIDGNNVSNPQELTEIIAARQPGDRVAITYEHNGKAKTADVTLKEEQREERTGRGYRYRSMQLPDMPPVPPMFSDDMDVFSAMAGPKLGVVAEERNDGDGLKILEVKPGSAAADAGILSGDVITKLDGEHINSVSELRGLLRYTKPGEKVKLDYQRGGKNMTTNVAFPKRISKGEF